MSGVARKLLGGVLAISLFISSSLSAFANVDVDANTLTRYWMYGIGDGERITILDSRSPTALSGTAEVSIPIRSIQLYSTFAAGAKAEPITHSLIFNFSNVPASFRDDLSIRGTVETTNYYPYKILDESYQFLDDDTVSYTISFLPLFDYYDDKILYPSVYVTFYNSSGQATYYSVDSLQYSLFLFTSSDNLSSFISALPSADYIGDLIDNPSVGNRDLDWYWYQDIWFENLGPFFSELFDDLSYRIYSYFRSLNDSISSSFASVSFYFSSLFDRMDKQDDDYAAVTDPSTSQEIEAAQGMIDTVEGFESQLHANITTEFDKIDFTTPTNLAAPVAYIGDKVTRSMNSLGNYQPLIFVPLTLGIMLIMLGRGITALGAASVSAARSDRRDGLENIRSNSHDERWLW